MSLSVDSAEGSQLEWAREDEYIMNRGLCIVHIEVNGKTLIDVSGASLNYSARFTGTIHRLR